MTQRIYLSGIATHPDVLFVPQCSYIEIYITAFYIPPYSVVFAKCFGIKVYAPLVYVPPASVVFHKRCYIACNFSVLIIIPDISLMVKSCLPAAAAFLSGMTRHSSIKANTARHPVIAEK